jgi:hypothetical protein
LIEEGFQLIPRWSKSDKEHQRNNKKHMTFSAKIILLAFDGHLETKWPPL